MVIAFTALDKFGHEKKYSWWFDSLEFALDTLSSLTLTGRQVLQANLIEDEHQVNIPVEIFDGKSLTNPIKELENQWQLILDKPVQTPMLGYVEVRTAPHL